VAPSQSGRASDGASRPKRARSKAPGSRPKSAIATQALPLGAGSIMVPESMNAPWRATRAMARSSAVSHPGASTMSSLKERT
jgi:hypothetical protein